MGMPAREQMYLALRETAKQATDDELNTFIDLYLTSPALTQTEIARRIGRNKNTITFWCKKLRAQIPHATLQEAARQHNNDPNPQTQHTRVTSESLKAVGAGDIVEMLDMEIRKLQSIGDYKGKTKDLLDLFKFKREYQDLQVSTKEYDPERLLGPDGLRAMEDVVLERLNAILEHRAELPKLWTGIKSLVDDARRADESA